MIHYHNQGSISTTTPIYFLQSRNFSISPQILPHKLLSQTTIIIGGSISTATPIFVSFRQFLNFTTNSLKNLPQILPQILPQTTTTNHYHNQGVNIYYHTNFCSNPTMFEFYQNVYHNHKFYYIQLPLSPPTPIIFSVPKRKTGKRPVKILRGLQRFGDNCGGAGGGGGGGGHLVLSILDIIKT